MGYIRNYFTIVDLNRSTLICQLNSFIQILDGIMTPHYVKSLNSITQQSPFLYGRLLVMSNLKKQEYIDDFLMRRTNVHVIDLISDSDSDSDSGDEFWQS
ncbi:MAG: hypothetical protein EBS55_09460 [Flavobacteriaceae bacterium]|nr:hypothetical protein [Flavobacteriaceae bacterium]